VIVNQVCKKNILDFGLKKKTTDSLNQDKPQLQKEEGGARRIRGKREAAQYQRYAGKSIDAGVMLTTNVHHGYSQQRGRQSGRGRGVARSSALL